MSHNPPSNQRAQLEALYTEMEPESLFPLWEKLAELVLIKARFAREGSQMVL